MRTYFGGILRWHLLLLLAIAIFHIQPTNTLAKKVEKKNLVEDIADYKGFKKLLRSRTNVLVFFTSSAKDYNNELNILRKVADEVRGFGTLALIDCESNSDRRKLCKKLKVMTTTYLIKHYKDGDFHKDYDRQMSVPSMFKFMRDPTGDLPWEEDPMGKDVVHFEYYVALTRHLLKDLKPMMVVFYAPWCGFCKHLKSPYSKAATALKGRGRILGAMNMDKKENLPARRVFNITGYPTLAYFENGTFKQIYQGDNNEKGIVDFMLNPSAKRNETAAKETSWSADASSDIVHLTTQGFLPAIKDEKSVLVMFYAPWCGHCKAVKPEYEKAAAIMKEKNIPGILAAVDMAKEDKIGSLYKIKGYPTFKYFVYGIYKYDVNIRDAEKLIAFMKDPTEPIEPETIQWKDETECEDIIFLNEENFSSTLKRKKHALIMFYEPWCGHCKKTKPEFIAAAKSLKDDTRIIFGAVDCENQSKLCTNYKVNSYPTIIYFSYLKSRLPYAGARTQNDFIAFMNKAIANNKDEL